MLAFDEFATKHGDLGDRAAPRHQPELKKAPEDLRVREVWRSSFRFR